MLTALVAAVAGMLIAGLGLAALAEQPPEEYVYRDHTVHVHGAGLADQPRNGGRK